MSFLSKCLLWVGGKVEEKIDESAEGISVPEEQMLKDKAEYEAAAKRLPSVSGGSNTESDK